MDHLFLDHVDNYAWIAESDTVIDTLIPPVAQHETVDTPGFDELIEMEGSERAYQEPLEDEREIEVGIINTLLMLY